AVGETTVTIGDLSDPDTRYQRNLRLVLPADESQAITITERCPGNTGLPSDETDLAADDFRVLHSGRTLQRLLGGTNPRQFWAPIVEVTYTPRGNAALREEATIKLIQLDLSYQGGMRSEKAGDYAITLSGDYAADREAILQGLENRRGMVMA
ncbi:MAG: hypothetical protein AAFQ13_00660, partial [Pseudomonadota bacterium]